MAKSTNGKQQNTVNFAIRVKLADDKTTATIYRRPNQPETTIDFPAGTTKEQALAQIVSWASSDIFQQQ